jgi:hypothetical protein
MKKVILFVGLLLSFLTSQVDAQDLGQNSDDSSFDSWTYQKVKEMVKERQLPSKLNDAELRALAFESKKGVEEGANVEKTLLQLYSLDNQNLAKFYAVHRTIDGIPNKDVDNMSNDFFNRIEAQFHENALLVILNSKNDAAVAQIAKLSFSQILELVFDYSDCLLCCPKASYPNKKFFIFNPKKGNSIKMSKADYTQWYSDKICGFNVYDFPCGTIIKARVNNVALSASLGISPRFNTINKGNVHVPAITAILVWGLSSLNIPPCQNTTLMDKVKNTVRVKCQ